MPTYHTARQNMVQSQIQPNGVLDPDILARFAAVPREKFLPPALNGVAYTDTPLTLAPGRDILPPVTLARMVDAARPAPHESALTVAGSTGYGAAILAGLVRVVTTWEDDGRLKEIMLAAPLPINVTLHTSPINMNSAPATPFDVIIVEGAVVHIPDWLTDVLNPMGRMVALVRPAGAPVAVATLFEKTATGHVSSRPLFDAAAEYISALAPTPRFNLKVGT